MKSSQDGVAAELWIFPGRAYKWLLSFGATQGFSRCFGVSLKGSRAAHGTHVLKQLH